MLNPYEVDLARLNATLPCLLPPVEFGRPLFSPYNAARFRRARAANPRCFADVDQVVSAWRDAREGGNLCDELEIRACAHLKWTSSGWWRRMVPTKTRPVPMKMQNTKLASSPQMPHLV